MHEITGNRVVSAYSYAVSEENASGGLIVTAPAYGAVAGCQAEIGSACSMTAAHATLFQLYQ